MMSPRTDAGGEAVNRNAWIAALVLGCSLGAYAQEQTPMAETPTPAIPYASTEAALEALRAKPGVTERSENDWFVVSDTADHVIWSITMPDNVMHPSIVRRALVEKDGAVHVEMSIKCGASKVACDELARTFQEINDGLRERMKVQKAR